VCYCFASLIVLKTGLRGQISWTAGLLCAYWLLMEFFPVPGIGAGIYEPGSNFAAYIDSLFLTGHMWAASQTWDPEGLVSTLPALATTLFGVLTGRWLRSNHSPQQKAAGMLAGGSILLLLGLGMNLRLPINKNLWTSSFSIFMAGMAAVCLACFYWLIDVKSYRRWAKPFMIFGMNAITAYVVSEAFDTSWRFIRFDQPDGSNISLRTCLFRHAFLPLASPINASLLFAISYVLAMYLVVWFMWKHHWFLKV
jgi:predicted acyltransferase